MDKQTVKYRQTQFAKVCTPYHEFLPHIKITKPNGDTNWLAITEDELQAIIKILTK